MAKVVVADYNAEAVVAVGSVRVGTGFTAARQVSMTPSAGILGLIEIRLTIDIDL
jgi:hypothetical protein